MKLTPLLITTILVAFFTVPVLAQDKWDLKRSVEYAWEHNVTVKQASIQAGIDSLTLRQSRLSQYPFASANTGLGLRFGRSIDPSTNQYTTLQFLSQQYNFQTNITVYNWGNIKNSILAARYGADASKMDIEKARNDLALNVATGYLQALLAREQVKVAENQLLQTQSQLLDTRKRVDAGSLPELNAVQLEAQLATDSSNLITAKANAEQNILSLKALLYLDAAAPFELDAPPVDVIPVESIAELQPDFVFNTALKFQPAQKSNELRIKSLEASVKAAHSLLYPTLSAFGALGTNFSNSLKEVKSFQYTGYSPVLPGSPVAVGPGTNVYYPVVSPTYTSIEGGKSFGKLWNGYGSQLNNNFGQNFGLQLNIPIFNGGQANINYQKSKLNLQNGRVTREAIDQTLKQNIYQAYNSAVAALQKYNANQSTVVATQKAFDFANKRYALGLLSTFELITAQTNATKAKLDLVTSHYDYVFKMKVLEFYKGQGIRLQ
ncbi:MAG: TolC family protein [Chitinophagaceae bacterium]